MAKRWPVFSRVMRQNKRVPWVSWFSTGFTERLALDLSCLDGRRVAEISHDNYFHSVLGLMDVQTSVYQKPLDVYAPCRRTVRP